MTWLCTTHLIVFILNIQTISVSFFTIYPIPNCFSWSQSLGKANFGCHCFFDILLILFAWWIHVIIIIILPAFSWWLLFSTLSFTRPWISVSLTLYLTLSLNVTLQDVVKLFENFGLLSFSPAISSAYVFRNLAVQRVLWVNQGLTSRVCRFLKKFHLEDHHATLIFRVKSCSGRLQPDQKIQVW